jgi:tRNA dimethylallyltransferase
MLSEVLEFTDSVIELGKKNIFSIAGLTATGKTALAIELAEHILLKHVQFSQVDIISADSRQIFADIPLVSGADVPSNFDAISGGSNGYEFPYFQAVFNSKSIDSECIDSKNIDSNNIDSNNIDSEQAKTRKKINLHGISILRATDSWSVAHFQAFAQHIMRASWQRKGCVIVVGGTGLYHAHLFNQNLPQLPGPIQTVRDSVSADSLEDLQTKVRAKAPKKWEIMNNSDRNNPRRLVRVLEQFVEVAAESSAYELQQKIRQQIIIDKPDKHSILYITTDLDTVLARITQRVHKRIEQGALQEVEILLQNYAGQKIPQIMSATGVRELAAVLQNKMEMEQAVQKWIKREHKYAKAQLTWRKSRLDQVDLVVEV